MSASAGSAVHRDALGDEAPLEHVHRTGKAAGGGLEPQGAVFLKGAVAEDGGGMEKGMQKGGAS